MVCENVNVFNVSYNSKLCTVKLWGILNTCEGLNGLNEQNTILWESKGSDGRSLILTEWAKQNEFDLIKRLGY